MFLLPTILGENVHCNGFFSKFSIFISFLVKFKIPLPAYYLERLFSSAC